MNQVKLNELVKSKIISVPLYILRMYQVFNLTTSELVLLLFLYDKDGEVFNPQFISENLNIKLEKVMEDVSNVVDKGLMNVVTKTNDVGIKEEIIDLSPLFNKITIKMMEELNKEEKKDLNIYDLIKEEFNRNLTPMECERIGEWQKNDYSDELIKEAVKEATLNDIHSIRYIDKILYEWNKKGFQEKSDIKKNDAKKEKIEVYKCDWLDSDEEFLEELFPDPRCELNYFNDYSLLLAIMLSAQTTDKRVNEVTKILFNKYKSLSELACAKISDLEKIIYPLGNYKKKAYNVHEIAKILNNDYLGHVPNSREILESFPGVGRKTVNVFFAEYLNVPAIAVDTHVERVCKRLNLVKKTDNVLKIEQTLMKNIKKENWGRRHLQLVLFGRYYCKAKKPECLTCKLKDICKYKGD